MLLNSLRGSNFISICVFYPLLIPVFKGVGIVLLPWHATVKKAIGYLKDHCSQVSKGGLFNSSQLQSIPKVLEPFVSCLYASNKMRCFFPFVLVMWFHCVWKCCWPFVERVFLLWLIIIFAELRSEHLTGRSYSSSFGSSDWCAKFNKHVETWVALVCLRGSLNNVCYAGYSSSNASKVEPKNFFLAALELENFFLAWRKCLEPMLVWFVLNHTLICLRTI